MVEHQPVNQTSLETNDKLTKIKQHFSQSSHSYEKVANLQRHVGQNLLDKLKEVGAETGLDLGCGPGLFTEQLNSRCQLLVSADLSKDMLAVNTNQTAVQTNAQQLCFQQDSFDFVYSSLMVQWCDLSQALQQVYQVLKPGKKAVISTLVAGTLKELSTAWAEVDNDNHIHDYLCYDAIVNTIKELNWSAFETQQEAVTLFYPTVNSLAKELKGLGANFVQSRQNKGLMPKSKWFKMVQQYQQQFFDHDRNMFPATYEVVYLELTK